MSEVNYNVHGNVNIGNNENPNPMGEGESRKRKNQPTETIDLSTSSDDEEIIVSEVRAQAYSNKTRKTESTPRSSRDIAESESINKNNADIDVIHDHKQSAVTAASTSTSTATTLTLETRMNGTRHSSQKEDHLLPNNISTIATTTTILTKVKPDNGNASDGIKTDHDSLKRNHDGSRVLYEDTDDSSSTSSNLRQFMRLDAGFSSKNYSNTDTNETKIKPLSEITAYNNAVETLDSDSDSSIEVVNAPRHRIDSQSPGGRLSGRQRRLEAARSKNFDGVSKNSDTESSSIVDMIEFHGDDTNTVTSSDKEKEEDRKAKEIAENTSDGTLSTSTVMSVSKNQDAASAGTRKIDQSEYTDTKAREATSTGTLAVVSRKLSKERSGVNIDNNIIDDNGVGDDTMRDEDESNLAILNRTNTADTFEEILDQTATPTTSTNSSTSGIFDNLYGNGKDFISWAKIDDPKDFLSRNDLAQHVNSWRKIRNFPPFNDSTGFVSRLKSQVRDNMKSMSIEIPSIQDSVTTPKQLVVVAHPTNKSKNKMHPSLKNLPMKGEDFMQSLGITNPEDFLQQKGLSKLVNPWRQKENFPAVKDPTWYISQWKKHIRERLGTNPTEKKIMIDGNYNKREDKNNYVSDGNNEDEFPNCMALVSALSKRFLNVETGLPVYQFAVYDTLSDDVIYEFRVEAKTSLIEGAGNGAFLTFLGARESRQSLTQNLDTVPEVKTVQPLVAKDSDGYHMNIKIVGEHPQRQNWRYPLPTSLPPMHVLSENSINDKYPWNPESEGNRLLTDYVENPQRVFSTHQSGCSTIDLGRYGPFQRSDRKVLVHYEIKNFIFSNEVSEWGFDLREDLRGEEQVADITDDTTGIPHGIARQNISMYVNETGGDPELKQTVFSGQVLDREVNYYFKTEKPMKKGETIELLISYLHTYDEIRERKGYGERNKKGDILGDDHFPTFLERNFVERYDMVEVIYEVNDAMDLYQLSEFLEGIREKLAKIMDTFISELQSSSEGVHIPYAQQMIALRRLNWLKPFFEKKIESIKKKIEKSRRTDISCLTLVLQQCTENAKCLDWTSWPILLDLLDKFPNLVDNKGVNVRSKFGEEVTEDISYGVSSSLFCPCHEAIWCGVAATLIRDLCYLVARNLWDYGKVQPSTRLSETLVQKASEASKAIQDPENLDALKFDTDVWKRYLLKNHAGLSEQSRGTKCVLTMADDCSNPENKSPAPIIWRNDSSVMGQRNVLETIHKPWYLIRQIIFVVDMFAKKYLVKEDKTAYSFDALCKKIGVSSELASEFLKRDIKLDLKSPLFYGRDFKSIYSKGNKLDGSADRTVTVPKTRKTGSTSMPVRKLLFWNIIIYRLKVLGWKVDRGHRESDWYLLPPGVKRGKGFKPRIDFFDSAPLVIQCLKTNRKYCDLPEIKSILVEYNLCQTKFEELKAAKDKFIKNAPQNEIVDFLRKSVMGEDQSVGEKSLKQIDCVKDIVFLKPQLGLMLVKNGSKVVVREVSNQDYKDQIHPGDVLISIGDASVRNRSLSDVVQLLASSGRPLNVKFEYTTTRSLMKQNTSEGEGNAS